MFNDFFIKKIEKVTNTVVMADLIHEGPPGQMCYRLQLRTEETLMYIHVVLHNVD